MSDGHCFISYSHADGLDFVIKLVTELEGGYPLIPVWFEKRDIHSDKDDWDDQIAKAIQQSKCLIYVMSQDSTAGHSNCKDEWTWALKYKKPVICLWIDNKAEDQFRLNNRQKIDFIADFGTGLGRLRKTIAYLDSPEGQLEELNHRLNDATRDLRRAKGDEDNRIKAEIEELKKQIEAQQKFVDNPKAAQEQTQKNIEAGLERERKPEKPIAAQASTKFINPPPGIAPNYFQDRFVETEQIVHFLQDDSQRMMTIVGRGGVGKTAMVCRLLKGLEGGELPDGLGSMKVDGIVYLSESGSHRVNFANLFYDLCKLLPADVANALDAVYKNPQASTASKMSALLDRFTVGNAVLLLDNVEPLISVETFDIADAELDECLRALLHGAHSALKVILTTRVAPRGLNLCEPGRQRVLTLDSGLEQEYAVEMLREMDVDAKVGLKSAAPEALKRAYERTLGFPRALEALFAILASDRYTTLDELLAMPTPVNVVEALVGEAFNRLDTNAQKVMQALAVYNRPVTPAAVDYLLAPHIPTMDSAPILQRLANMHFARKESGRFYLHPVDRENILPTISDTTDSKAKQVTNVRISWARVLLQVLSLQKSALRNMKEKAALSNMKKAHYAAIKGLHGFIERLATIAETKIKSKLSGATKFTVFNYQALHQRAIDYFIQIQKPSENRKIVDDLSAQLSEFELRNDAGDYESAQDILDEIADDLDRFGYIMLLISLLTRIRNSLTTKASLKFNSYHLARAYKRIGKINEAMEILKDGLEAIQERDLFYKRFLLEIGSAYERQGEFQQSIEYYNKALFINSSTRNSLYNNIINMLASESLCFEAICLRFVGSTLIHLGNYQKSEDALEHAILISEDYSKKLLPLYNNAFVTYTNFFSSLDLAIIFLVQNDLENAQTNIEFTLQYDVPENNHDASALHGIIALRQGDEVTAREAFVRAIGQADEILSKTAEYYSALDAKGLSICGLVLCGRGAVPAPNDDGANTGRGDPAPTVDDAIETFKKARKIAPHAGVVKSVLRLFDELVKCDTEGILKEVRSAAEGV